jgi:hypothetical protein
MPADASGLVAGLVRQLYAEFADRATPQFFQALVESELSRWQECTVRDFVPIFVGRRVRAQLLGFA